jgi:hypothetical protein
MTYATGTVDPYYVQKYEHMKRHSRHMVNNTNWTETTCCDTAITHLNVTANAPLKVYKVDSSVKLIVLSSNNDY